MHRRLTALGYPFERQCRVNRWRIDLALPPLALELERGFGMPHENGSYAPDTFGGKKFARLLSLLDRGWYVMTMRPPWVEGWDEAPQLVINYLREIGAGTAPRYVSYQQHRHHEHWLKSVGTYEAGVLTVEDLWENKAFTDQDRANFQAAVRAKGRCRIKMCGDVAVAGLPHCAIHAKVFADREAMAGVEAQVERAIEMLQRDQS